MFQLLPYVEKPGRQLNIKGGPDTPGPSWLLISAALITAIMLILIVFQPWLLLLVVRELSRLRLIH